MRGAALASLAAALFLAGAGHAGAAGPNGKVAANDSALGGDTYRAVCMACHASENVMVSSPKLGDVRDWQRRLSRAGSFSALTENALNGYEAMPAKGGRPDLQREQIEAAIRFMMQAPPAAASP